MSFGLLVGRFGDFLEAQPVQELGDGSEPAARDDLMRIREAYGHHVIALMFLSRVDGESVPSEREVILIHCVERAKAAGVELTEAEKLALNDHLYEFRPVRAQIGPAVRRMHRDSKDDIVALVAAAVAVVDADGVRRPSELRFLEELRGDLSTL